MSRFVNIDNVMEPAQISQNSNQDSVPSRDSTRGEHSRSTSHQSPSRSWTGVRSLLGGDRGKRGKEGGTDGPLSLQSQDTNLSSLPSDPALSSSSSSSLPAMGTNAADKIVSDRNKPPKKQKAKEPKSYKSSI